MGHLERAVKIGINTTINRMGDEKSGSYISEAVSYILSLWTTKGMAIRMLRNIHGIVYGRIVKGIVISC